MGGTAVSTTMTYWRSLLDEGFRDQSQPAPLALGRGDGDLLAGLKIQFLEDACNVVVYRTLGDYQLRGDLAVGMPPSDEMRNLLLTAGEIGQLIGRERLWPGRYR